MIGCGAQHLRANRHRRMWQKWMCGDMPSVLERLASFPTALPVSLQLSLLRVAFAMLSLEVLCPWSFPTVAGASQTSAELRSLPRSSPVFSGVPQSSPEFPSLLRSSPVFAGAPPCPPEFLLVRQSFSLSARVSPCPPEFLLVRRSSCYSLRAPFPRSSSEILRKASPVF